MFDADAIDFGIPVALFPLPSVPLFPHALQALHVFERRYRRMVEDALGDAADPDLAEAAPIAMATFDGDAWKDDYGGTPALRPAVCVGRIVRHRRREDGRHDIVLHGVARARIEAMLEPDGSRPYRMAELVPLERPGVHRPPMRSVRGAIGSVLARPRLGRFEALREASRWFAGDGVPTHAAVEVAGNALLRDPESRYRMLAEGDPYRRAVMVRDAALDLERLVALAERQRSEDWPTGQSWN